MLGRHHRGSDIDSTQRRCATELTAPSSLRVEWRETYATTCRYFLDETSGEDTCSGAAAPASMSGEICWMERRHPTLVPSQHFRLEHLLQLRYEVFHERADPGR